MLRSLIKFLASKQNGGLIERVKFDPPNAQKTLQRLAEAKAAMGSKFMPEKTWGKQ